MSRPVEEVLEFDRLREIVGGFTTCAPGRRAVQALVPRQDITPLDLEFALVREAVEYLRPGTELGFGSLADPGPWLGQLAIPSLVLSSMELLDAASLMDTATAVRQTFKGESGKISAPCRRSGIARGPPPSFRGNSAHSAAER